MRIRTALSALLTSILLFSGAHVSASQLPDSSDTVGQAAAMTLTNEDLPTGFMLMGEVFLDLPDADGVTAHYVSSFVNTGSGQQIRSYVYLFETDEQATAGFAAPESDNSDAVTDGEVEVGSGSAELSLGTYEAADGKTIGTADVTFVRDNVVAGVAVDNADGSEPDGSLATDLATSQDARIQQVQSDSAPVDMTLPSQVVPYGEGGTLIQSGFLTSSESEAIYGTEGSALSGLESSWVQTFSFGENSSAPRITVGVTTFASDDDANAVVEQSDSIFQPMSDQESVEDVVLEGADDVVAYRYTSRDGSIGNHESYRIIFSHGATVTVVDVQGASDDVGAEDAANSLAKSQLGCQTDEVCDPGDIGAMLGQ